MPGEIRLYSNPLIKKCRRKRSGLMEFQNVSLFTQFQCKGKSFVQGTCIRKSFTWTNDRKVLGADQYLNYTSRRSILMMNFVLKKVFLCDFNRGGFRSIKFLINSAFLFRLFQWHPCRGCFFILVIG